MDFKMWVKLRLYLYVFYNHKNIYNFFLFVYVFSTLIFHFLKVGFTLFFVINLHNALCMKRYKLFPSAHSKQFDLFHQCACSTYLLDFFFNGSGFPIPSKVFISISFNNVLILFSVFLSCVCQYK